MSGGRRWDQVWSASGAHVLAAGLAFLAVFAHGSVALGDASNPNVQHLLARETSTQAVTDTILVGLDFAYHPSTMGIRVGDTVLWLFESQSLVHTVTNNTGTSSPCTEAPSPLFDNSNTFSYTFTTAGTYGFFCRIVGHCAAGEHGSVTVSEPCAGPGLVAYWPAEGTANDDSGNDHHGVLENGATFAPGKVGTAFSLDGMDDNVSVPDSPAFSFTTAMSVEGWINTTAGIDRYITTKHDDSFYFAVGGGSIAPHKLSFWLNGVSSSWFTGSTTVDDGQWHHVAATYDGSTMRLYVDGNLDASAPHTGSIQSGASGVLIGARYDGANASNFPGMIDELSLYNRALGPAEVQALAAPNAPCATAGVDGASGTVRVLELSPPRPNPATQRMTFEFQTPSAAVVSAEIVDIAGRRVSLPLKDQLLPDGVHQFRWDGLDTRGQRVAPGVYMVRLRSGGATAIQKIVLVR